MGLSQAKHKLADEIDMYGKFIQETQSSSSYSRYSEEVCEGQESAESLHWLLEHDTLSIHDMLQRMKQYPAALTEPNPQGELPIHLECKYSCRSIVISNYIELCPQSLTSVDDEGLLPLHRLLENGSSSIEDAIIMIDRYPAALKTPNQYGFLPIHIECSYRCRSTMISKCIELYPESLTIADEDGYLPLHALLSNKSSSIDDALIMIEQYPAALEHQNNRGDVPINIECMNRCRSAIISKCIELYSRSFQMPLHILLGNESSFIDDALGMIEKSPSVLRHQNKYGYLPIHIECGQQCRSAILSACIEGFADSLAVPDKEGKLALHILLQNSKSSEEDALMMIEKYPMALEQPCWHGWIKNYLPIHIEAENRCRSSILMKCIQLYPESLDENLISLILQQVNQTSLHEYSDILMKIFVARPMSLYCVIQREDVTMDPSCRRKILNLLPRAVFTPTHYADYRDLNWQPRNAMMLLLSQQRRKSKSKQENASLDGVIESIVPTENPENMKCRYLTERMMKASSLAHIIEDKNYSICQHEDIGDVFLRSVLAFL